MQFSSITPYYNFETMISLPPDAEQGSFGFDLANGYISAINTSMAHQGTTSSITFSLDKNQFNGKYIIIKYLSLGDPDDSDCINLIKDNEKIKILTIIGTMPLTPQQFSKIPSGTLFSDDGIEFSESIRPTTNRVGYIAIPIESMADINKIKFEHMNSVSDT